MDSKIELTAKMVYGFCSFDSLKSMVMLRCSGFPIALPWTKLAA